ncbi:MAG: hypothetical protein RLZZ01_2470, partial [Actinomycetota bacterium]
WSARLEAISAMELHDELRPCHPITSVGSVTNGVVDDD